MRVSRVTKKKALAMTSLYYQHQRKARIINAAKAMYLKEPDSDYPCIWVWP